MKIFISYASEDKDEIARPLAETLRNQGYEVWYAEYSLMLGDSLSEEIDRGLSSCDYGVVILSPQFFEKKWPKKELAGLVVRETSSTEPRNIILPVWHGVELEDVRKHSPTLADRVAVNTKDGLASVVDEINRVTQFVDAFSTPGDLKPPEVGGARAILDRIVPAGPIQPDMGLSPAAIAVVEDLVRRWEENGELSLLAKVGKLSSGRRKVLFHEEKQVFLRADQSMHQIWIEIVDMSFSTMGTIWTPPNVSDRDFNMAVEFFLREMGFFEGEFASAAVSPIINSDDSFWLNIG